MPEPVIFATVDDDPINNTVVHLLLRKHFPGTEIAKFTNPAEALVYILPLIRNPMHSKLILFLDINMPEMTGWEFIAKLVELNPANAPYFFIYVSSSSVNPEDLEHARSSSHVIDFIEKPLSKDFLQHIAEKHKIVFKA